MVFDYYRAVKETNKIVRVNPGVRRRKYPVYIFQNSDSKYICEVRYGGPDANALQRGQWTHTKKGLNYFNSITDGWVSYEQNKVLVKLFSHALVSSQLGHNSALNELVMDIERLEKSDKF